MDSILKPKRFMKRKASLCLPDYFQGSETSLPSLLAILLLPKRQRSDKLVDQLVTFTHNIKVFAEMSEEMSEEAHRQCCECLGVGMWKAGKVRGRQYVFREGDAADNFYIILSGSCSVLSTPQHLPKADPRLLSILRQGECFGELALLGNHLRTASILCREDCYLAYLSREDYARILSKIQDKLISVKVELLLKQAVFRKLSKNALMKLTYFFKIKRFARKQTVFEAGNEAARLYLVKEGEFQLTKDIFLGSPAQTKTTRVQVDVTLITVGEFLGSDDVVARRNYSYSCNCHSTTGELMVLGKKDFFTVLGNEETLHYFASLGKLREEYRRERVETATQVERAKRKGLLRTSGVEGHLRGMEKASLDQSSLSILSPQSHSRTYSNFLVSSLERSGIKARPSTKPVPSCRKTGSSTQSSLRARKLRRLSSLLNFS